MLDHPNITVELGVDASDRLKLDASGLSLDGEPFTGTVVYTGAVTSCSAAASAACLTAPWTSSSRPTRWSGSSPGAR